MFEDLVSQILPLIQGNTLTLQLVLATLLTWLAGRGLVAAIQKPKVQGLLGHGLKTADIPGAFIGGWLQVGPLRTASAPFICLGVFLLFWLFSVVDKVLTYQKPETRSLVEALEKILERVGSTRRRLYIQTTSMDSGAVGDLSAQAKASQASL